jgi:two-component system capsular synthesis sensor histidine kinase RcsC
MIDEPRQSADATRQGTTTLSRILIADDDAFTRHLLETLIERANLSCAVVMAENGQHALHIYQQEGADLIITDNNMPVMGGVAFIRAIRQKQHRVPIIMLSGSPDVRREAYAAGVTMFLEKPVNIRHLVHTIAEFLPHSTV